MITVELVVRDGTGGRIDPVATGVDAMVRLIRDRLPAPSPPTRPGPGRPDADVPADHADTDADLLRLVRMLGPAYASLEAVEAVHRQTTAIRSACISAMADHAEAEHRREQVVDELMTALLVSRRSATFTREQAEALRSREAIWSALARGAIDTTRAVIIADAVLLIPTTDQDGNPRLGLNSDRDALTAEGLAYATEHAARRLGLFLRRRLTALGAAEHAGRRRRALARRGVWIHHDGDGTADLTANPASQDAERVYATIRAIALADRNGDPTHDGARPREPMDIWMAAALVDAVLRPAGGEGRPPVDAEPTPGHDGGSGAANECKAGGTHPTGGWAHHPGRRHGGRRADVQTVINVTIPISSLAGLSREPGILNGFGVIPAEVARRLAAGDARWRQILFSPTTGALLDVGTLTYRPPPALARHVRLRDGTRRFPGCSVPAGECDLDHLVPFPLGPTSAANLHALCRRHHGLKHDEGWTVKALPGHALRWTSPQGATATTHPDDTWTVAA